MRKKLLAFDLDGTLTPPYKEVLVQHKKFFENFIKSFDWKIAIITWSTLEKVEQQLLDYISSDLFAKIYVSTCNGWVCYIFDYSLQERRPLWEYKFDEKDLNFLKSSLYEARDQVLKEKIKPIWEDFVVKWWYMVSFSVIWKDAPDHLKENRDPEWRKRKKLIEYLKEKFSQYEFYIWWRTAIDILPNWVNKWFVLEKLVDFEKINKKEVLFFGDWFVRWGNDWPVKEYWFDVVEVSWLEQTFNFIKQILWNLRS